MSFFTSRNTVESLFLVKNSITRTPLEADYFRREKATKTVSISEEWRRFLRKWTQTFLRSRTRGLPSSLLFVPLLQGCRGRHPTSPLLQVLPITLIFRLIQISFKNWRSSASNETMWSRLFRGIWEVQKYSRSIISLVPPKECKSVLGHKLRIEEDWEKI